MTGSAFVDEPRPEGDAARADINYASWGQRFGSKMLDGLIVATPFLVLGGVLAILYADDDPSTDEASAAGALMFIPILAVSPFYFAFMHGRSSGQTVGKRSNGIAVRRADTLAPIGYGRAFARAFVTLFFLVSYVWVLDILWPLWDRRRQTLHDKVAGSVVIRT